MHPPPLPRSSYLLVTPPRGLSLSSVNVSNASVLAMGAPVPQKDGVLLLPTRGLGRGLARVALVFSDGSESVAHFHVLPPLATQVAAFGHHLATVAWLPRDYPDPFGRCVTPARLGACAARALTCALLQRRGRAPLGPRGRGVGARRQQGVHRGPVRRRGGGPEPGARHEGRVGARPERGEGRRRALGACPYTPPPPFCCRSRPKTTT